MIGNATQPCGKRRLTEIVAIYAAQRLEEHILINLLGILAARHDALHHTEHHRPILREQPLTGCWPMLPQVANQSYGLLFHLTLSSSVLMPSTYIYTLNGELLHVFRFFYHVTSVKADGRVVPIRQGYYPIRVPY